MTSCEVVLVNRNVIDSFRVGKDGCTYDTSVCVNSQAKWIKSNGLCLCSVSKPNLRNPTTRPGNDKGHGCIYSGSIRAGVGGSFNYCALGPFKLISYKRGESARKFSDIDNPKVVMNSCSLRHTQVKFPDNATEMEQQWLDESYVDLNVSNNAIYFKWKRSVPNLQGTIITFNLYCEVKISGIKHVQYYHRKCLRAKVLGIWSADAVSVQTERTKVSEPTTSGQPKSLQITTKTISSAIVTTTESKNDGVEIDSVRGDN
ncbi:Hypothetical predicted protein [Paramuricea clavata]|uniref:Uncharacterized protein n=1 Tax=Paramuricea clavata TaxID=317549 RepID=A0A6S7LLL7_PARCT|nr:Hypothetical predicted protein [Paramuricea clavata]